MREKSDKKFIYVKVKMTLEEKEAAETIAKEAGLVMCEYLRQVVFGKTGISDLGNDHIITVLKKRNELLNDIRAAALYRINILSQLIPILQDLKKNPNLIPRIEAYEMFCLFCAQAERLHNKKKKVIKNVRGN